MNFETFIKWALPKMGFRWEGFRRVVGQVESCVRERMQGLGIGTYASYREFLEEHPGEWEKLDACCRITISRFYRDAPVVDALRPILRVLAERAADTGRDAVRAWSAGAASGEEPYTLAACWQFDLADDFPDIDFSVVASEADPHMIRRAERGRYPSSSLRELPEDWREAMFDRVDDDAGEPWRLRDDFRTPVRFVEHDVRDGPPAEAEPPLDLIGCRYLVFTYLDADRQAAWLERIRPALRTGGCLVIGADESLPQRIDDIRPVDETGSIFEYNPQG